MLTLMVVLTIILLLILLKLSARLAFVGLPMVVERVADLPWYGQAFFLLTITILLWSF